MGWFDSYFFPTSGFFYTRKSSSVFNVEYMEKGPSIDHPLHDVFLFSYFCDLGSSFFSFFKSFETTLLKGPYLTLCPDITPSSLLRSSLIRFISFAILLDHTDLCLSFLNSNNPLLSPT